MFQKNYKVAKNLFIVWITFLICWLPIVLTTKIDDFKHLSGTVYHLLYALHLMNSVVNFSLYGIYNRNFRKAYFSILRCGKD